MDNLPVVSSAWRAFGFLTALSFIIYDFSNVAGSGVFASAEFNGYVVESMARSCGEISSATVDRTLSNLALGDDDVAVDGHTVRVNFAGLPFDDTTFVKIDVVFAGAEGN